MAKTKISRINSQTSNGLIWMASKSVDTSKNLAGWQAKAFANVNEAKSFYYTDNELEFIGRSSPLISHQLIIPKNEFVRFKNDYIKNLDVINPEIIVFDANVSAFKKASISDAFYCQIYSSNEFKVYIQKKIFNKC